MCKSGRERKLRRMVYQRGIGDVRSDVVAGRNFSGGRKVAARLEEVVCRGIAFPLVRKGG
jgi:hypothetical protein